MKIKNANGEIKHTPKGQAKENAKKELRTSKKGNTLSDLQKRMELIEKYLGI